MTDFTPPNDTVLFERIDEHVALVTLNRPEKRNAVNGDLAQALGACVDHIEASRDLRVAILTSSIPNVFCAGADLAEISAGRGETLATEKGDFAGFVYYPRTKPWIAAARGATLGGGMELCLACDLIVAADSCRFGLPEVKRCLLPGAGGLSRLPNAVPLAVALEMIMTGDPIDAKRAYEIGLVNRVVAEDAVLDEAKTLAATIAANAPLAVYEALSIAKQASVIGEVPARALILPGFQKLFPTEDYQEGPRAFLEKRAPVWKGQ